MSTYLTIQEISAKLQTALLHARIDFLLQQAKLWQEMNATGMFSSVYVKPENLDLSRTKFEFYISPKTSSLLTRFFCHLFRIRQPHTYFKLCNRDLKAAIKVSIDITMQMNKQLKPQIRTEPNPDLKPEETYVTGLSF